MGRTLDTEAQPRHNMRRLPGAATQASEELEPHPPSEPNQTAMPAPRHEGSPFTIARPFPA